MKNIPVIICMGLAMAFGAVGGALADGRDGEFAPYAGLGFSFSSFANDANDTERKILLPTVFGGVMLNRNFGVEGGFYRSHLEVKLPERDTAKAVISSLYLIGVGKYYTGEKFAVYGKAGFHRWESTQSGGDDLGSVDGVLGAGAQYDLSENTSVRLEFVRHFLNERAAVRGEVDNIGFHMLYRF